MSQKSSLPQAAKAVSHVLMSDSGDFVDRPVQLLNAIEFA
jgi:hypothetical protein